MVILTRMSKKDTTTPERSSIWEIDERFRPVYILTLIALIMFLAWYFFSLEIDGLPNMLVRVGSRIAPFTLLAAAGGFILTEMVVSLMVLSAGLARYLETKRQQRQADLEAKRLEIAERKRLLSENQVEAVVEIIKESTAETHERLDKVDKKLEEHTERMDKQDSKIERVEVELSKLTKEQGDG